MKKTLFYILLALFLLIPILMGFQSDTHIFNYLGGSFFLSMCIYHRKHNENEKGSSDRELPLSKSNITRCISNIRFNYFTTINK